MMIVYLFIMLLAGIAIGYGFRGKVNKGLKAADAEVDKLKDAAVDKVKKVL